MPPPQQSKLTRRRAGSFASGSGSATPAPTTAAAAAGHQRVFIFAKMAVAPIVLTQIAAAAGLVEHDGPFPRFRCRLRGGQGRHARRSAQPPVGLAQVVQVLGGRRAPRPRANLACRGDCANQRAVDQPYGAELVEH